MPSLRLNNKGKSEQEGSDCIKYIKRHIYKLFIVMKWHKESTEEEKNKRGFSHLNLLIKEVFNRLHVPCFGKLPALLKTDNISTLR